MPFSVWRGVRRIRAAGEWRSFKPAKRVFIYASMRKMKQEGPQMLTIASHEAPAEGAASTAPVRYKSSGYNHAVSYYDQMLVFNGVSSALVLLDKDKYARLQPYLFEKNGFEIQDEQVRNLLPELLNGKYIVEESFDELDSLRQRFRYHQENDSLMVTIATTMDCNLGCYYCYEDRYETHLSDATCDEIFRYIDSDLTTRNQKRLHVTWYGGEPMLNRRAIDYLSEKLVAYCDQNQVRYSSSIVTNGTMWPRDPAEAVAFIRKNKIRHVQFSFDGLEKNHNNRRHYKDGNRNHSISSFDALCSTVDALRGHAKIYLRMNLDTGSQDDARGLIDFFVERKWLFPGSKVYPYLSRIGPLTDACSMAERTAVDGGEFNLLNNELREYMAKYFDIREFAWTHFPRSLRITCSAVAGHSVLFGPDGALYKCPHDLGVQAKSHGIVGNMKNDSSELLPILNNRPSSSDTKAGPNDYLAFDPFTHPKCSVCKYLPICMGGCPKVKIENRGFYNESFCKYWEVSLDPMIRTFADSSTQWQTPPRS
jgi:uncharacterized protein